jgi:thiosulfate dehydrogenase
MIRWTIAALLAAQLPIAAALATNPAQPSFAPPPRADMPKGPFGDAVKLGENIFRHTTVYAHGVIGDALNCSNCHLDAGRLAGSAPMWAAYTGYPAYRKKNRKVNNFGMRLQGCFRFSENGRVPALDSKTIIALEAYSFWLAKNAPTGAHLAGRGYPRLAAAAESPDYARGRTVYRQDCSLCHGARGQGQYARGQTVFPPLWGTKSFNWGAGMGSVKNAAEFIYANMPFGAVGTLSVQQAWDVAQYVDSHDRPQDPRFSGSVAATRKAFHDSKFSMYGRKVNGHLLGSNK